MVEFSSLFSPDVFVRRPTDISNLAEGRSDRSRRDDARARSARPELSDGARQALRGSERALELARDFNAERLGRPARRRLGAFFQGLGRELGGAERDIERTARRIAGLTDDLGRRFGAFGASLQSSEFSISQVSFSLQVDTTLLAVVEDGEASFVRLDQIQLSLQAVQIEGSVSVAEGFAIAPRTPLFGLAPGDTPSDAADRLTGIFGASAVSTQLEAREIELDLSTTVFQTGTIDLAGLENGSPASDEVAEGGVSVVA